MVMTWNAELCSFNPDYDEREVWAYLDSYLEFPIISTIGLYTFWNELCPATL